MQSRAVLSRAKSENGASSKIVRFMTGRKRVIDGEREKMKRNLWSAAVFNPLGLTS